MSLTLAANFATQQNLVIPLAQSSNSVAVRVASNSSAVAGSLTASGAQSATVSFAISGNPSWITIAQDTTTLICYLSYTTAQAQTTPYQFLISCSDGFTTQWFAVLLEVKDPFTLAAANSQTVFNVPSYDSGYADIVFRGYGLNGIVEAGVQFIEPPDLPPGLNFITFDGSKMALRVADSTASNLAGGLQLYTDSPATTQVTLEAFEPGTMYDNPDRSFVQEITIQSLTAQSATLDLALAVNWNLSDNAFRLDAAVDFLSGLAPSYSYLWTINGSATGAVTSGGSSTQQYLVWAPASAGTVIFTFAVINKITGATVGQITTPVIPCSSLSAWTSTSGVKIQMASPLVAGSVGADVAFTVSTPAAELAANETIILTPTIVAAGTETAITPPAAVTLTASASAATLMVTIPASGIHQKWMLNLAAANAASNPTRTGFASAVIQSNGLPSMVVSTTQGTQLTGVTGQPLTNVTLTALYQSNPVSGVTYSLLGAPAGYAINQNQLTGQAFKPGSYSFEIIAEATGYARSYSAPVTVVVTASATPLKITAATPSVTSVPDGQQFNVTWGLSGTPTTMTLMQNYSVRNVLGITEIATSEVGSSVITVFGESYYGDAYSAPALVLSSSITAGGVLLNAPTVAYIDNLFNLTIGWQPPEVNGSYQAYLGFNIWLSAPNQTPVLQSVNGQVPTGLEVTGSTPSSRLFVEQLAAGDYVLDMQALSANFAVAQSAGHWDQPHQFPTGLLVSQVSFDHQTVSLGQPVNITLATSYTGANQWCCFFSDSTDSGWLPLSVRTVAKAFTTPGPMSVVVQTQNDFSGSNPPVKLRRQVTATVFVMDQQYNPTLDSGLAGTLGFGGTSGFEVTDASEGAATLQPYEVVVRALVRDVLTHELKLMVATSRTANASSVLGTMAIDVFPLMARPRTQDLVEPGLYLSAALATVDNPVEIATATLANAVVGQPYGDFQMATALNTGVAPFSWYCSGLPAGLKMSISGTISGTPLALGTATCDFVVIDSNVPPFMATVSLDLTVASDLTITTAIIPPPQVNQPYGLQMLQSGGLPPYSWSIVAGAPPTGLTLDPNTGILGGYPVTYNSTTDFTKQFSFTIQVTDAIGAIYSQVFSTTLLPATLAFGLLDQTTIFAGQAFRLRIPVYGGKPPYTLTSFADQGTIGPGLQIVSPLEIAAVAGITPATLTITTTSQQVFPPSYPAAVSVLLGATGGLPPYQFTVIAGSNTTLPTPYIMGNLLTGTVNQDGFYVVEIECIDAVGNTDQINLSIQSVEQNAGVYQIKPVTVAVNGSNNPANWTVTPISALPDAKNSAAYRVAAGTYYGLALYQSNVLHMTQSGSTVIQTINLSTGLNAAGAPWTAGSSTDANWYVQNQDNTTAPALTVAPGQPDFGQQNGWANNDGNSDWICRNPLNAGTNVQPYSVVRTFNLTGYSLANTTITGQWAADSAATLTLNGNVIAPTASTTLQNFSIANNSPYYVAGINTLAINITQVSGFNGARLTGTVQGYPATQMNFTVRAGALPTGIVAFSGNSFGASGDYSGIELFNVSGGQNATVNGTYSFQAEFSNIVTTSGTVTQAVARNSITVTDSGGGTTPAVVVTVGSPVPLAPAGSIDQHWTITSVPPAGDPTYTGPIFSGPNAYVLGGSYQTLASGTWLPNGPDAQWIAPDPTSLNFAPGNYSYQTTFDLSDFTASTATLYGNICCDNSATVYVNGTLVFTAANPDFTAYKSFTVTSGFLAGINTIVVVVNNAAGSGNYNPTGLRLALAATAYNQNGAQQVTVFSTGVSGNAVAPAFTVDLTTLAAPAGYQYDWFYPLTAEGGTAPYQYQVLTDTTLPRASINQLNGLPALVSDTTQTGSFIALVAATDITGVESAPASIVVNIEQSASEPIHIVAQNLPTTLYAGRAIPANLYFVETDLLAAFAANNLPPGISLSAGTGKFCYLQGTPSAPTGSGNYSITVTATSLAYNTTVTTAAQVISILPQTAVFQNAPTAAVLGTAYRVTNNSAIIFVQYQGWQPNDANLPLPTSAHGTLGAPGVTVGGVPTTGISSLTSTGFVMAFDYTSSYFGADTLSLSTQSINIQVGYPALTAVSKTVAVTVSEYSQIATFTAPVTISGGLAPYTIALTGFSDPRFSAAPAGGGQVEINASQFTAGTTATCSVSMTIADQSGQSAQAVGVIKVTIQHETYIQVSFTPGTWKVNVSSGSSFTASIIPNVLQSTPLLGHQPFQYYVDQVIQPVGLANFVKVSPTNRVLAIQFNQSDTSATVADADQTLAASGTFVVPAIAPGNAPAPGTYAISLTLRVVDSEGYSASSTVALSLVIS